MNSSLPTGWDSVLLRDSVADTRATRRPKIQARDYAQVGRFPVVDQGQRFIAGYTDDSEAVIRDGLPYVVFGDHTRVFKYVDFPFALGADGTQLLKPRDAFDPRFFAYACQHLPIPNRGYNRHFVLVKEMSLPQPPFREQQRIAAVLSLVQRAMDNEEKAIAVRRELKRAALTRLFSEGLHREAQHDTEVGAIPRSWQARPFSELREFLQYGTSAKCDYAAAGNPVLRIPNVVDGRVNYADLKRCTLDPATVESLLLEVGDILFIRTNGVRERVGSCAVYENHPEHALFASYLIRARVKLALLVPKFFQYYTETAAGSSFLSGRASPAADGKFNVNTKTIDSVLVPVPTLAEQQDIVAALSKIDQSVRIHERRLATLTELFTTLLDKLMTGEIRVDKLDTDTSEVAST